MNIIDYLFLVTYGLLFLYGIFYEAILKFLKRGEINITLNYDCNYKKDDLIKLSSTGESYKVIKSEGSLNSGYLVLTIKETKKKKLKNFNHN
jgi:hypothetical protein